MNIFEFKNRKRIWKFCPKKTSNHKILKNQVKENLKKKYYLNNYEKLTIIKNNYLKKKITNIIKKQKKKK